MCKPLQAVEDEQHLIVHMLIMDERLLHSNKETGC